MLEIIIPRKQPYQGVFINQGRGRGIEFFNQSVRNFAPLPPQAPGILHPSRQRCQEFYTPPLEVSGILYPSRKHTSCMDVNVLCTTGGSYFSCSHGSKGPCPLLPTFFPMLPQTNTHLKSISSTCACLPRKSSLGTLLLTLLGRYMSERRHFDIVSLS